MSPNELIDADDPVVIIGGGPAGLTAAYKLAIAGIKPLVLEKLDKVGGIARTEVYKGYHFDMGCHRFFTKSVEVNRFWHEILGDELLTRPRLSRIYYNQKFFNYPLKPLNALSGLGIWFPYPQESTFEEWVTNRFGRRLFRIFFKSYTEKVWGISTSQLSAEWAAQRIKGLDLKTAIVNMFVKSDSNIKTLIEEFYYPARGPGMLWTRVQKLIEERGGVVSLNSKVSRINWDERRVTSVEVIKDGEITIIPGSAFISSMPITELILKLDPPAPKDVLDAANQLTYRDFLTICLIVDKEHLFNDNWIYIHEPGVKVGRIQNFKNWSPAMVPDISKSSLGLEYFCNEGDEIWDMDDAALIELAKRELEQIGLVKGNDVLDGIVYRVEKSYPVYEENYRQHLDVLQKFIGGLENIQTIGRNGLHKYNNQDHAMLTGMFAVKNLLFGEHHDIWAVNAEKEYHEEILTERAPDYKRIADNILSKVTLKLDPLAFGLATGLTLGGGLVIATIYFGLHPELSLGNYLWLLGQYFPFYRVTVVDAWWGFVYGFAVGISFGWMLASMRNLLVKVYFWSIRRRIIRMLMLQQGYFIDPQAQNIGAQQSGEMKEGSND